MCSIHLPLLLFSLLLLKNIHDNWYKKSRTFFFLPRLTGGGEGEREGSRSRATVCKNVSSPLSSDNTNVNPPISALYFRGKGMGRKEKKNIFKMESKNQIFPLSTFTTAQCHQQSQCLSFFSLSLPLSFSLSPPLSTTWYLAGGSAMRKIFLPM
jgi:hypothetical protein